MNTVTSAADALRFDYRGAIVEGPDAALPPKLRGGGDAAAVAALRDQHCLKPGALERIARRLARARQDLFDDVELLESGRDIPPRRRPLDAGFVRLPQRLLNEFARCGPTSLLGRIQSAAGRLRKQVDRVVLLGIGGSYMGARALFEALCDPYHNERPRAERRGTPRLYFEGNNLDNDTLSSLLDLLRRHCSDPEDLLQRWAVVVVSKSGGTLETAVAFRCLLRAAEAYYGTGSVRIRELVAAVTGDTGRLRTLADAKGLRNIFPIPDGVGGRFSVFTAVGLLPGAILGLDVARLLEGAAAMTRRFAEAPVGDNPVLDYAGIAHLMEEKFGATIRVLSVWSNRLEAVGLWYDQLLAESLGKQGRGATPITAVNTRDLHSRGQQHQEGRRDKLITNLLVDHPGRPPLALPIAEGDHDGLGALAGRKVPEMLAAAVKGTNLAYYLAARPTTNITLPKLNEYCLGQLLQMLMLATVVEGRLIGINPYGQPGVEAYKRHMQAFLTSGEGTGE